MNKDGNNYYYVVKKMVRHARLLLFMLKITILKSNS